MHIAALQSAGKKQQLKSAEGQLTSAKGKYEGAAAQLAYSEVRSPIDGVVTDRPTYPGETPPAGTPLLTVMDTSSVIAKAHIPQDQAVQLKPGDAAADQDTRRYRSRRCFRKAFHWCARRSWRDPAGANPVRGKGSARPVVSVASWTVTTAAKRTQQSCGAWD